MRSRRGLWRQPDPALPDAGRMVAVAAQDECRDERRPPGLVPGTETGAGVAVEILREHDPVAPVRMRRQHLVVTVDRPAAVRTGHEQLDQPFGQFVPDRPDVLLPAAPARTL